MQQAIENATKRQKIEEESQNAFWGFYLPNSVHPNRPTAQYQQQWFRFPTTWAIYYNLVKRKWHLRWYLRFILNMNEYQMWTFETLQRQGAFRTIKLPELKATEEFWEQ